MERLEHKNVELTEKLFAAKDELLEAKNELLEAKNELLASKDKIIALHEENKRLVESVSAVVTPTEAHRLGQSSTCHLGQTCEWCYRLWCVGPYQ